MTNRFHSPNWHRVARLCPRVRPNVRVHYHRYRGQSWYVLQDPATGKIHRLTPAAYTFVKSLDGETTVDAIWHQMAADLEDDAPAQEDIISLLAELHQADILNGRQAPDGEALQYQMARQRRAALINAVRHPLSTTIPLWDADEFLNRHAEKARVLFNRSGLFLWCVVVLPALFLSAFYVRELWNQAYEDLISVKGLLISAFVFPVMKLIHEAGHAFALKSFGGSVHRTGVILVAFLPMPYVDASGAAALPSKAERTIVGAAGMMAELFVAALAVYFWSTAEPGFARDVALCTISIAVVSVLVVNGNPLMRFDGYYILTDVVELPNLAQRSSKFWSRRLAYWLAGVRDERPEYDSFSERVWFACYGPLAFVYRIVVILGLSLWVAKEYLAAGIALAALALLNAIAVPAASGAARMLRQADAQGISRMARSRIGAISTAAAILIFVVPLPLSTRSEAIVGLPETAYVRASVDGFVATVHASPADRVAVGDPVVTLQNAPLTTSLGLDRARLMELQARLTAEQFNERALAEVTRAEIAEAQQKLNATEVKIGQLTLSSGQSGTVVSPAGTDLAGRYFNKGEVIAIIRPDEARLLRVLVRQDDIELVRQRASNVNVLLASDLDAGLRARVVREVPAAGKDLPSRALTVAGGGQLSEEAGDNGEARASESVFVVELELEKSIEKPAFGSRAYVRFDHGVESFASQAYRRLRQLFLTQFNA